MGTRQKDVRLRRHVERITRKKHTYSVRVKGSRDPENHAIVIENAGKTCVEKPRVRANDKSDWFDKETMVRDTVRGFRTDEENNAGEYSNPAVDDILDRAGVELDYETSMALYQEAEQMLVEDAACIPLWFPKNYYMVKPYVSGYELMPMGYADLSRVSIERD